MSRVLVVYFSRTGHTERIALEIAMAVGADLERIEEPRDRSGIFGYWRSGREAFLERQTSIQPSRFKPSSYELVVLGTPIWAGHTSSPVRTYVTTHAGSFRHVAFFCTHGGTSAPKVMSELAGLCGIDPVATLAVTEREIRASTYTEKIARFLELVQQPIKPDQSGRILHLQQLT